MQLHKGTQRADEPVTLEEITRAALWSIQSMIDDHATLPSPEARDAMTLWILHTYALDAFNVTPRLSFRSKEPGSGKSVCLELVEHMVPNPINAVNLTTAVMWRAMGLMKPVMLIDESDVIWGQRGSGSASAGLRGVVNSGYRRGASVLRTKGAEELHKFPTFGAVALAGLGRLPDTLASRSVEIVCRRRQTGDPAIRPFRLQFAEAELKLIRGRCEAWAKSAIPELKYASPAVPAGVVNRAAEIYAPLLAIGELAGTEWTARTQAACVALTAESAGKETSVGVQLLTDVVTAFEGHDRLFTADLLERLYSLKDTVWRPSVLDGRKMAVLLGEYGVRPGMIRDGANTGRGYLRNQFEDAWIRNLAPQEANA